MRYEQTDKYSNSWWKSRRSGGNFLVAFFLVVILVEIEFSWWQETDSCKEATLALRPCVAIPMKKLARMELLVHVVLDLDLEPSGKLL